MNSFIYRLFFLFFILSAFNVSTLLAGGGWTQKKHEGYFKLSEWWIVFDKHYTDAGLTDPNTTTGIYNTNLFVEYGFTDRLNGILNAAVFSRNYMNNIVSATTGNILVEGEALNSIGDIDLGLKYGILKPESKIKVAASLILGIPTGVTAGGTMGNLQTGDGEFNQMIQFDGAYSYKITEKITAYTNAMIAFNNRTANYSDEVRYGFEAGISFFREKIGLIGRLSGVESLKNGSTAQLTNNTSIFANNTEYGSYGLEMYGFVTKKIGFSAAYATAFHGEIIAAAPSYSIGVFYNLREL